MNIQNKFGAAINCIDGRVQIPVIDWIKLHSQVQFVDMITEPGADKILGSQDSKKINSIIEKLYRSINAHHPILIAIAGHYDCVANPATFDEHKDYIEQSVDLLDSLNLGVRIVGLYVNEWNSVDVICDNNAEFAELRSFL